jgi:hypothetical protein
VSGGAADDFVTGLELMVGDAERRPVQFTSGLEEGSGSTDEFSPGLMVFADHARVGFPRVVPPLGSVLVPVVDDGGVDGLDVGGVLDAAVDHEAVKGGVCISPA